MSDDEAAALSAAEKRWEIHRLDIYHKVTGAEIVRVHYLPSGDIDQHVVDVGPEVTCPCDPKIGIQDNDAWCITHNSWDGREIIEQLEAIGGQP